MQELQDLIIQIISFNYSAIITRSPDSANTIYVDNTYAGYTSKQGYGSHFFFFF